MFLVHPTLDDRTVELSQHQAHRNQRLAELLLHRRGIGRKRDI
jgi:hypothetical protein